MRGLTDTQRHVLHVIREHVDKNGYPPTVREICDAVGYKSTNAAGDVLKALERKGAIATDRMRARGIRLLEHEENAEHRENVGHALERAESRVLALENESASYKLMLAVLCQRAGGSIRILKSETQSPGYLLQLEMRHRPDIGAVEFRLPQDRNDDRSQTR
jgi:SOS-response transcriptional repressor LexA